MSSISFRRPEFRLHLGYPDIILTASGRTLGRVGTEAGDFRAALRRLAEVVLRARGRLVAVLPDTEVWRGRLDLAGRTRAERRANARTIVAGRLGTSPDDVTVVIDGRDPGGSSFAVVGVRRSTLFETRALLAAVGLRPSAIVGAPGFLTSPRLDGGWSWPLPSLPPERRGLGAAIGAGAIVSLAVLVLGMPASPPAPPVLTPASPVPVPMQTALLAPEPPTASLLPPAPPPLALRVSARPKPRPAAPPQPMVTVAARNMPKDLPLEIAKPRPAPPVPQLQRLAGLTTAPVRALDAISAPLRRPAARPAAPTPDVTQVARTAMPVLPAPAVPADLRPMPRPRPTVAASVAPAAAEPAAAPPVQHAAVSPRSRAQSAPSQAAVLVASLEPAPFAEATLAAAAGATVAAALAAPPARPAAPPAPKAVERPAPVAKAAPVVVRPKPVEVQQLVDKAAPQRAAPVAQRRAAPRQTLVAAVAKPQAVAPQPAPVRQKVVGKPFAQRQTLVVAALPKAAAPAAPVRQKVVAKPVAVKKVPVKQVKAKTVPVRQAAKDTWAPEPVTARAPAVGKKPAKAKPAAQRVGLSRGKISLVGVFAGSDGRTALVRLPNGSIEKVKAGDRVQGVQIAAINEDSVQVSGRGRDTLLRLPD